jgi:hypothetical protein
VIPEHLGNLADNGYSAEKTEYKYCSEQIVVLARLSDAGVRGYQVACHNAIWLYFADSVDPAGFVCFAGRVTPIAWFVPRL